MDWLGIIRTLLAMGFSVLSLGLIPLYGSPFGGCEINGFFTLQMGCSSWPEFMSGFMFVGILSVIAPHKYHAHYIATVLMLTVASFGGFKTIRTDSYFNTGTLKETMDYIIISAPLLYGAISALILYLIVIKFWRRENT